VSSAHSKYLRRFHFVITRCFFFFRARLGRTQTAAIISNWDPPNLIYRLTYRGPISTLSPP
jgi:hypothetical protein